MNETEKRIITWEHKTKKATNKIIHEMANYFDQERANKSLGTWTNALNIINGSINTLYRIEEYYLMKCSNGIIYYISIKEFNEFFKEKKMTEFNDCKTCKHNMKCKIKNVPKTCPEFEKIKKDLDFQINDKVYDLMFGNGIIVEKDLDELTVLFGKSKDDFFYDNKGIFKQIEYDSFTFEDMKRTLYHGHDLKVTIKEKEPVRYPWINIIYDPTRDNLVSSPKTYDSKEIALKEISNTLMEPWIYSDTIQLIANHLKEK